MKFKSANSSLNQKKHLAIKYSLFNTYMAILSLSSYPNLQSNNRLSALHGLATKKGKRKLNTQRWVWLVGPVWSCWSSWFDSLTGVFLKKGVCYICGAPSVELVSRAFAWLTLGQMHHTSNFPRYPLSQINTNKKPKASFPYKAFAVITGSPRSFYTFRIPTFALSGSNVRHRTGWAVLPGPTSNKALSKFTLTATLAAYRLSKPLIVNKWGL